jgi:hypothetical protein
MLRMSWANNTDGRRCRLQRMEGRRVNPDII